MTRIFLKYDVNCFSFFAALMSRAGQALSGLPGIGQNFMEYVKNHP